MDEGLESICRGREAVARGRRTPCNLLRGIRSQARCQRYYAASVGRPSACPKAGSMAYEGLCAALAWRDPSFCRLARDRRIPLCVGALKGKKACTQKKGRARVRCAAAAATWKGKLKVKKPFLPTGYQTVLEARITALSSLALPGNVASFTSKRLHRGVLLADKPGHGDAFAILQNLAPVPYSGRYDPGPHIKLWVPLPQNGMPGRVQVQSPSAGGSLSFRIRGPNRSIRLAITGGKVTFSRLERKVGGRIIATFSLLAGNGVDRVRLEGRLDTFVRQLIPLSRMGRTIGYRASTITKRRYGYNRGRLRVKEVAQVKKSIRKLSERRYEVDNALRDAVVKDTAIMITGASIYRYRGKPKGYKLSRVYRNSVLWQLGLRDRDVLLSVNKKKLSSREAVFIAYAKFRRARKLTLELLRNNDTIKLVYRVKRTRKKKDGKLVLGEDKSKPSAGILGTKKKLRGIFRSGLGLKGSVGVGGGVVGMGRGGGGRGGGGRGYGTVGLGTLPLLKRRSPKKKKLKKTP
ncbi:MAG: hypothetical protein JRH20_02600 [Deltaproteobacteria bacterium]|nr:hypothetical protein [Deltaproteobacteria bacterium]